MRLQPGFRDVHFSSAYGRVQQVAGGKAVLAVLEDETHLFIMQPFIKQSIQDERYDLKNPYGYGGPVGLFGHPLRDAFAEAVRDWAQDSLIVSEYCRLHPLYAAHQLALLPDDNRVAWTKDVIVIDDLQSFNESRLRRRTRRGVKAARANGAHVLQLAAPEWFAKLYEQAMEAKRANGHWRFDDAYWRAHDQNNIGARWFFVDSPPGHYRRALLTIGLGVTAYAHFLGSDGDLRHSGLDELLYFEAALALAREGFERFHLGGAVTNDPNDSLLLFKSGFSDTRYRVGSYDRVFRPDDYRSLLAQKQRQELLEHGRESTQDWFPEYRRGFA